MPYAELPHDLTAVRSLYWRTPLALLAAGIVSLVCSLCVDPANAAERDAARGQAAVTPAPPEDKDHEARHLNINERAKQGRVDLIFIGDSITQSWETNGQEAWEKFYAKRNAMNAGMSGDSTQRVLWRLDHGNIDGIAPKLAVLMIGTNNITADQYSADQIADGIEAVVVKLRDKLPRTKVLVLGIFPRDPEPSAHRQAVEDVNRRIARLADNKEVFYLDIGSKFVAADGKISKDIMPDFLHLSPQGYEIWAESIEPKVAELMGEGK